ncbi:transposon related peptidoglycan linked protein (LPXTG motif) [Streptococcus varani]|uniref:Transposon related peptidoglycan linked protein (LPXTG motif) n=1 Tax=Streptococcus varani TaxID=1608583 RepID=A0A0E4H587_9STRE|nr:LPXTG cell wall anchor domain-containing protein [Streptococcus varani]CQR25139.1 transposon related peptidoglycan linked protein (LPXTG motif) [Streptococcus varani]
MTKKQILSALALSTLPLAQAGLVSADEVTPVDPSSPSTEVVTPVEPSAPVETPTEPTQPVETPTGPTTPTEPVEPANPTPPVEPTDPSTPQTTEEPKTEDPTPPSEEPVTPPSDGNGQTTPVPTEPSTGEAPQTIKPIPEPVVTFNPFETPGGQTVVGTQNSQVVIQNNDGSTQTVNAEEVGGATNADGTVTVKAASGEVKTLPQTGEEAGGLFSLLGTVILTSLGFLKKKKII